LVVEEKFEEGGAVEDI